ncbi:MAG: hypothetical protein SPG54_04595, partial [Sodaliphilus sp.]|nr:hypothetical protein [Sodaliphilus sp.]
YFFSYKLFFACWFRAGGLKNDVKQKHKKTWNQVQSLAPHPKGLRIARSVETSNVQPHAKRIYKTISDPIDEFDFG